MEKKNQHLMSSSNIITNNLTVVDEHSIAKPIKAKFKTRIAQKCHQYSQFMGNYSKQILLAERSNENVKALECTDRRSFYNNMEGRQEVEGESFENTERLQYMFSFGGGGVGTMEAVNINKSSDALGAKDMIAPPPKKARIERKFPSAQERSSTPAPKYLSQIQQQSGKDLQPETIKQQMAKEKADMRILQPIKDKRFAALDLYWLEVKPELKELYTSSSPKHLFHIYYSVVFDPSNRPVSSYTKLFICYVLARYHLLIKQIKDKEKISTERKDLICSQNLCSMDILTKDGHWKFSLQGSRLSHFVTFVEHERFNLRSPSANCILFCDAPSEGPTHTMNYLLENPDEVAQILQNIPLVTIRSDLLNSINTSEIAVELSYQAYKRWSERKDMMKVITLIEPKQWNPEPTFPLHSIAKTSSQMSQVNSTRAPIVNNELPIRHSVQSANFVKTQNSLLPPSQQAIEGQLKSKAASSIQSLEKESKGKAEFIGESLQTQTKYMPNMLPPAANPPKQNIVPSAIAERSNSLNITAPVQQTKIQTQWASHRSTLAIPSNPPPPTKGKMYGISENVNLIVPALPLSLMPISIPIGSFPGQPILLIPSPLQSMLLSRPTQADSNKSK